MRKKNKPLRSHILMIETKIWWHDDVIKWKHFPRYWPLVRSPVNSPHKGQWRVALMFSFIIAWINDRLNNGESGDLRHYRAHCNVTVMRGAAEDAIIYQHQAIYACNAINTYLHRLSWNYLLYFKFQLNIHNESVHVRDMLDVCVLVGLYKVLHRYVWCVCLSVILA